MTLIIDFHSQDWDKFYSKRRSVQAIYKHEEEISSSLLGASKPGLLQVKSLLGLSLQEKLKIYQNADLGIYPFGSGMCAMAHLTNKPIIEYRPASGHLDIIRQTEAQKKLTSESEGIAFRINYDNILFLDNNKAYYGYDDKYYWFDPISLARLCCLLISRRVTPLMIRELN